jgi:DNA helicase-2/ATP-dependent DNA helicase PcrA
VLTPEKVIPKRRSFVPASPFSRWGTWIRNATHNPNNRIIPSKEQQRIIDHPSGHLQVIACAGSGKTEAISQRIARLMSEGVMPKSIIAFTFTNRAADSMKNRIMRRVAERMGQDATESLGGMFVGTIHSYCYRLLREHVPGLAKYDTLDDHKLAALLARENSRIDLPKVGGGFWACIEQFKRHADVIENELIDILALDGTDIGLSYSKYLAMLEDYKFLTYGQQIAKAIRALEDPEIARRAIGQIEFLFVDEYQDINPAQERLIALISRPPVQLCVVGDDDQAIYQWRGSNVENLQQFRDRYKKVTPLPLETNRRSRPNIVAAANTFSSSISPRLPKKMKPVREHSGPETVYWSAETPDEEAERIAQTIVSLINAGYRYADVGILLRSVKTSSAPIVDALRRRRIPFSCSGRTGLFLHPEVQAMGETYAWLTDSTWRSEKFGSGEEVTLRNLTERFQDVFEVITSTLRGLTKHLETWKSEAQDDSASANLVRGYYGLLRRIGVHKWDPEDPTLAMRLAALAKFSELLADFEHVSRRARWVAHDGRQVYRAGTNRGAWYYKRLYYYIQLYALDSYEDHDGENALDLDAVSVSTVHQAKGLDWPIVFVPCLVARRFPSSKSGTTQDWLIPEAVFGKEARSRYEGGEVDERRLFYVALTRAKEVVYLSRFRRIRNRQSPSPFLTEVASGDPGTLKALPLPPLAAETSSERLDLPTISLSDLLHYDRCHYAYRLSSLLGFQTELVAELGYGRAVHHVLSSVADFMRTNGRPPAEPEISALMRNEFYLPLAHQEAYRILQSSAEKLISNFLVNHGDDLLKVWQTERTFELRLDAAILTGRADVLLHTDNASSNSVALVDYKTARDPEALDLHKFQLAVYAAAGRAEGFDIAAAYIHDLRQGTRISVPVGPRDIEVAKGRANGLVARLTHHEFDPSPGRRKCQRCDTRQICEFRAVSPN